MADLVVVAFDNAIGADEVRDAMVQMQKDHIVSLEDAAVVVRKADGKVKVKQATNLVGAGAMGGAFWGMLIGLLFMVPWLGLAVGALSGALGGKLTDIGVDDKFIKEVGNTIQPGHSALFLLIREATPDRLLEELKPYKGTVLKTSLSKENEAALKAAFGAEE
ncbi:MAG: DUF1269 domain-containing protein [Anaerolineales bacterium]|nr:MAG: DUF1269 domain-containing protein [Anaerolineales bacterium]